MRKLIFLMSLSVLAFCQPISSPLGLGFLEMGWRYSGWNPAALRAVAFDGFTIGFSYMSDMSTKEFSALRVGYQSIEEGLTGELSLNRISFSGDSEYSIDYTVSGESGSYYWGLNVGIYHGESWESTMTKYGLRMGIGVLGISGDLKVAIVLKDVVVYSSEPSEMATGEMGVAFGWISDTFAIHFGLSTWSFKAYDVYTGIAAGKSPAFVGVSAGYTTDLMEQSYHFGGGFMWQGKGFFMTVGVDFSQNPIKFGRFPSLPYRFTIAVKFPGGVSP